MDNNINALKARVAEYLSDREGFRHTEVLAAFPAAQRDFPLKRPAVAVGLDSAELSPGALGGYYGEMGGDPYYGGSVLITVRFDIYAPLNAGGDGCHRLYEALCDALILSGSPFGFASLTCGEVAFDKSAAANRMTAKATLRAAVALRDGETAFAGYRLVANQDKE